MKILLSGGWGYGNLGDDAILYSSIILLKEKYPDCTITVLSYNIQETELIVGEFNNITLTDSLHTKLYGLKYKEFAVGRNLIDEVFQQFSVKYKLNKEKRKNNKKSGSFLKNYEKYLNENQESVEYFKRLCRGADMYVMSGGGYLTTWAEMHISKFCEIDIAKKCNLKTYVIGQTISPLSYNSRTIIEIILKRSDGAFFRDTQSIQDANTMNIHCYNNVVPDLVLSNNYNPSPKENYIVLIPFTYDLLSNKGKIIENIVKINKEAKSDVYIAVSQQWPNPIKIGLNFYFSLKENGINAKMIIPKNFWELLDIVASAQMVFSQNLHGLILSYCSHTPVVSLNKKRKFVSFMEMIGKSDNMFSPQDVTEDCLYNCFKRRTDFNFDKLNVFRDQINEAMNKTLK